MNKPRLTLVLGMIAAAAAARLVPHAPNFSPVGAMALFAGATLTDKRLAFLVPLLALFLSDLVLGFYSGVALVYGSFALIVAIGLLIQGRRSVLPIAGAALAGSVLFFLITNLPLGHIAEMYPFTLAGIAASYTAAIPFFQNTVAGDLCYAALLFGGFALAEKTFPALREPAATAAA